MAHLDPPLRPPPYESYALAPLTLLGWTAWRSGDLSTAQTALVRALQISPDYTLAQLFRTGLIQGVSAEGLMPSLRASRAERHPSKTDPQEHCPGCAVPPGTLHANKCDVARCAACGRQRTGCGHNGSNSRTAWTGQWPGFAEATEYGFYARLVPGEGWQPCSADTPDAMPDLNRLYHECRWDPHTQRMIRFAL